MRFERVFLLLVCVSIISLANCERLSSSLSNKNFLGHASLTNQQTQKANDIFMTRTGDIWISLNADDGFKIYKFSRATQTWDYTGIAGPKVCADKDGRPWVVEMDFVVHYHDGTKWVPTGKQAFDVGCPHVLGDVHIIGTDFAPYRWTGSDWSKVSSKIQGLSVAVDNEGNPWVLAVSGEVSRYVNGQWVRQGQSGNDLSCAPTGWVFVISATRVNYWDGSKWKRDTRVSGKAIAGGSEVVSNSTYYYAVDQNENIQAFIVPN